MSVYKTTPMYPHSFSYAREHGETESYRASMKANIACACEIEAAIAAHYQDNHLNKQAVHQVVGQFDYKRTLYVLANTIRQMEGDGRISRDNKEWARKIALPQNQETEGSNLCREFVVDGTHPGLTDLFLTQTRREVELKKAQKQSRHQSKKDRDPER